MKKLLTLLLSLAAFSQLPAQVSVTCNGQEVKDGDELVFYASEEEDPFGGTSISAGPSADPTFTKTVDSNVRLSVRVITSENCYEGGLNWCGITTQCQDIKGGVETRGTTLGELPAFMTLHANFTAGQYETYTATVTVSANGVHLMTFTERFIYDAEHLAIDNASTARPSVKFDGAALRYTFASAAPRTLQVYSIDGKLVKSLSSAATDGSLSLDGLQRGIYVYSLREKGKQVDGKKIVIK